MRPILQLLPISKIDYTIIIAAVTPAQWVRFQQYARRVRAIIELDHIKDVHQSVWMLLDSLLQGAPLLPRLVRLHLDVPIDRPADYLRLLSPSLRNLELSFCDDPPELARGMEGPTTLALLQVVLSKVPDLKTLRIPLDSTGGFSDKFVEVLTGFVKLESLLMKYSNLTINHGALLAFSRMSSLRSLHLTLSPGRSARNGLSYRRPTYLFPYLQELDIGGTLGDLAGFFNDAELRALVRLAVSAAPDTGFDSNWKATTHSILATLPQDLRSLSLGIHSVLEIFEPCLSLTNLEVFETRFNQYEPHLSDEDVLGLASAWPKLHVMCILYLHAIDRPKSLRRPTLQTLVGLAQLSQRCPLLHELEISSLDVSSILTKSPLLAACHRGLRVLNIARLDGRIGVDMWDIALMLDKLFPRLDTNVIRIHTTRREVVGLLEDVQAQRRREEQPSQDDTSLSQDDECPCERELLRASWVPWYDGLEW
ncbi:hypothetical protein C8Q73DRAFT_839029 [Cubamyces lactineus]|nr:hypothetical protein C8Q73DRAFT_839029 [Cubamyces lactineus]